MQSDGANINDDIKGSMVKMVSAMLSAKPSDPVPFMYSYI